MMTLSSFSFLCTLFLISNPSECSSNGIGEGCDDNFQPVTSFSHLSRSHFLYVQKHTGQLDTRMNLDINWRKHLQAKQGPLIRTCTSGPCVWQHVVRTPGTCPKDHRDTCTPMLIAAVVTVTRKWDRPSCQSLTTNR